MEKDTIIIVEGPQGAGKTTFTNYLREKMSATDLYRLQGIKDKTKSALEKSQKRYRNLLEYMKNSANINMLFDRTFFSEEIYSRLGYKEYSFTDTYNELLQKLDSLEYDIYLIILYLEDTEEYGTRLQREKHQYQKFEVQNSINQQNEYLKLADETESHTNNIKVIRFNNTGNQNFEEEITKQLGHLFI